MFQRKSLRRKLKDLTLEYIDEQIQHTVNHSPVEDARACMRLYKVFAREIGIYPVKIVWNSIFGSKEARFEEPATTTIRNLDDVTGPHTQILKQEGTQLGLPNTYISVSSQWGINELDERELLRVSIVNEMGLLVFDSIIQPSKPIKFVPLFDPSFGIPLKYLSEMLNTIFDKRVIVGMQLGPLIEMLGLTCIFSVRDILVSDMVHAVKNGENAANLAKHFFDAELDETFRSTITEARLYMTIFKNF
jgi:hypothetical protein